MKKAKFCFLDLNGVTIPTEDIFVSEYSKILLGLGIPHNISELQEITEKISTQFTNPHPLQVILKLNKHYKIAKSPYYIYNAIKVGLQLKKGIKNELATTDISHGVGGLLTCTKQLNIPTALVTNLPNKMINILHQNQNTKDIMNLFTTIITEKDGRKKPHPDLYISALKKVNQQNNPQHGIGIEDTLAGMRALFEADIGTRVHYFPPHKRRNLTEFDKASLRGIEKIATHQVKCLSEISLYID